MAGTAEDSKSQPADTDKVPGTVVGKLPEEGMAEGTLPVVGMAADTVEGMAADMVVGTAADMEAGHGAQQG